MQRRIKKQKKKHKRVRKAYWSACWNTYPSMYTSSEHIAFWVELLEWGFCEYIKVHTKFPPTQVILWMEQGGKHVDAMT